MRYVLLVSLLVIVRTTFSQGYISTTTERSKVSQTIAPASNDFWFAIPQNFDPKDANGEIFTFYITSRVNTYVRIQIQGQPAVTRQVTANQVLSYIVPRNLEINRSSAVETDKTIHIWSDNADLNVYFMSRNDYTSDGTVLLPTYAYGKEYVVAAASALYVSASVDLPSEFIIIAPYDNTVVTVTPSQDIRKEGMPTEVKYPKNIPFDVTLNKGECIQYQTTQSQDNPWDLSGTILSSNNPIAVIGASACPFIPDDPYCDHVNEMLPPTDTWGKKYYSARFAGRKHGGDSFLMIASKDGQMIYRNGTIYATLNKFETYFRDDISGANVWTSDAPFLLAQYINSAGYGVPIGQPRNPGDPAMLVLYPTEKAQKNSLFQVPYIIPGSGQQQFTSYLNILLPTSSVSNTKLDGKLLLDYPLISRTPVSGTGYEAFTIEKIGVGVHTIISDSNISAYVYGYSSDDSYAWSVPGQLLPMTSIDTSAPFAATKSSCYCTYITIGDKHINASKLLVASSTVDSNMVVSIPDGIYDSDSAIVSVCVADSSVPASSSVLVFDKGGNSVLIKTSYNQPHYFKSSVESIYFGTVPIGTNVKRSVEIENKGTTTDSLLLMGLSNGNMFTIVNAGSSVIAPGGKLTHTIQFSSDIEGSFTDTLVYQTACQTIRIPLHAGIEHPNGSAPDSLYVGCIPVGDSLEGNVIFTNANSYTLTIKEIKQYGSASFELDGTPTLPKTLAPASTAKIGIRFIPHAAEHFDGLLTVVYETADAVVDSVSTKLAGCGLDLGVNDPDIHALASNSPNVTHAIERSNTTDERLFVQSLAPNPASDKLTCTYALEESGFYSMEVLDILGKVVLNVFGFEYHSEGVYETTLSVGNLPPNSYIIRIWGESGAATAKVIIRD